MPPKKTDFTAEFMNQTFRICQPSGICCSSGCDGCELYAFKIKNGIPVENPRMAYYQSILQDKETK